MNIPARLILFTLLPLAAACGTSSDDGEAKSTTDSAGTTAASGPTWHQDVQPMLAEQCTRCHHDGGLGPGDFTQIDVVQALAPAMRAAMAEGRMPPAAADPSCRDYVGSDILTMPPEALALFEAWDDAGQPLGDPSDPVEGRQISGELPAPDVVLDMPAAYTPKYEDPRNPGNEYRCFVMDSEPLWGKNITKMAPIIDNDAIVHHVVLYQVDKDSIGEQYFDPAGWDCIDGAGPGGTDAMIAAWAPGMLPVEFPDGYGMPVPEGSAYVVQMHYFANGGSESITDLTSYAFNTTEESVSPVLLAPLGSYSFSIPAGDPSYTHEDDFENTYVPLKVFGMFPHMHTLGTSFDARIVHEDGSETCLVTGTYDFDNQMTYQFVEPPVLQLGDRVEYSCTWDNSEGTTDVGWGERTDEEMCYFFSLVGP